MSNIGIMSPAFFVGKNELIRWLNEFFDAGYTKVEQTCTGAMHCQILDAIYPGKVPLGKVNFDAKTEPEYVHNFKVLQQVFDAQQITKYVDVSRLIKGKFQDNLEMLQWMKNFFDTNYGGQPYNGKERREEARAQYKRGHKHAGTGIKRPEGEATHAKPAPAAAAPKPAPKTAAPAAAKPAAAATKPAAAAAAKPRAAVGAAKPAAKSGAASSGDAAALTEQLSKLTLTIEGLETERNFYFGKLREIEILCQDDESDEAKAAAAAQPELAAFKKSVLDILYATDDNAQFQQPDEATAGDAHAEEEAEQADAGAEEGLLGAEELTTE